MSVARRVGMNSLWLILQPLIINAVSLVAMGYITRQLGRAGFGLFNDSFAYVAAFAPFANLGLRTVSVRAIAERREDARPIFAAFLFLRLMLIGAVVLLAIATAPWAETTPMGKKVIALAAISTALTLITQTLGDQFRAFEQMRAVALADLVTGLLITAFSVTALARGYGIWGFTLTYALGTAVGLVVLSVLYLKAFGLPPLNFRVTDVRSLLAQAKPFFLMQIVAGVTDRPVIDVLLITRIWGLAVVGPYSAVAGLVNRLGVIPQGVTAAMFPAVAGEYAERRAEIEHAIRQSMLFLALATVPMAAAVSYFAAPIVRLVFGPQYLPAAPVLTTMIWVIPLLGPNLLMYDCLSAVRRQNVAAGITLAGGIGLIALFAILIPVYGPIGAAASTVAREVVLFVVLFREMRRSFAEPVPFRLLGKAAVALAAMLVPMVVVALVTPSLVARIAVAVVGVGLYAFWLLRMDVLQVGALRELFARGASG